MKASLEKGTKMFLYKIGGKYFFFNHSGLQFLFQASAQFRV